LWSELRATYVGPDLDENWDALFRTTTLFRKVATEVGEALGYTYPQDVDEGISAHLEAVRKLG
jgi:aminoglycoside 6-adenylyltransferase